MRLVLALLTTLTLALPVRAEPVTVFAAASLKPVLDRILPSLDTETVAVFGGSSLLARQIELGAPADIFLSANTGWMDHLETAGAIDPATRRDIVRNRLVLVGPPGTDPFAPEALATLEGQRIATALTDAVPAGIYARAALQSLGLWEALRPFIVEAQDVRAALRLAVTGAAPFAIVYASDAVSEPGLSVLFTFPDDSHPPIVYPAALTVGATAEAAGVLDAIAAEGDAFVAAGFLPANPE